ncbi:MAG: hypothetical protein WC233_06125 [Sphaerochaeta sp.]
MGKKSKTLLVALVMVAIILSAFIGCAEDETPDYKADFLGELKTAVTYNEKNIVIAMTGENVAVTFKAGVDSDDIKTKAASLLLKLKTFATDGTKITIDAKEYSLHDANLLDSLIDDMRNLFKTTGTTKPYTAAIKYKGQSFGLSGNITVTLP